MALTSDENAAIKPSATMVLYRLSRRLDLAAIEPLLFEGVRSVPGLGDLDGLDPGIERTRCGPTSRS
ncbi:MAG: hypothetical protein Q7U72_11930 [Brevundimonas sp.]|uniref:hypothetical protein n=1 Tax=Brevundimonas sp. TaxID=1871086 RepID=UPI00271F75A5|nr:hypothetical protein [Brevundimonas sp.]MDO9078142.1 hypothetical protein [Brevundimonas sp.]MDP3081515.1 hypothetical protein [Brevundimonas sp.]MDZ4060368.1 hypothetical protein [Brevundimonas sp.]